MHNTTNHKAHAESHRARTGQRPLRIRIAAAATAIFYIWSLGGASAAIGAAKAAHGNKKSGAHARAALSAPSTAGLLPQSYFRYMEAAERDAKATAHEPRNTLTPRVTLLDNLGQIRGKIPVSQIAGWKAGLAGKPAPAHAALLHIRLGEWELASNEQPGLALDHFGKAMAAVKRSDPLYGLASYDSAVALFYAGAYSQSTRAFTDLLAARPSLRGYERRYAALWLRHAGACAGYHAERSRMGIPEPPRLDPLCAAAAFAASLRGLGLPHDRKTVLRSVRVTGEGSNLQDVLDAAPKLGAHAYAVTADEQGLKALPKPLVAYVEHDHFIAVTGADKNGVSYLCSDCGPWPGGRVDLTWKQWRKLDATVFAVAAKPGGAWDTALRGISSGADAQKTRLAMGILPLGNKAFGLVSAGALLRGHVFRFTGDLPSQSCGSKPRSSHCGPGGNCPTDGDPVSLATGEEEYHAVPDLVIYNKYGPSVVWGRTYNSLRPSEEPGYNSHDFGVGWSHNYNSNIVDPNAYEPPGLSSEGQHDNWPQGDIMLTLPNGGTIKATAPHELTDPGHIALSVPGGTPLSVAWDGGGPGMGVYTVTMADHSKFIYSPALTGLAFDYYGASGIYSLTQIKDRMGHRLNLKYEMHIIPLAGETTPPQSYRPIGTAGGDTAFAETVNSVYSTGTTDLTITPLQTAIVIGPLLSGITDENDTNLLGIKRAYPTITDAADAYQEGNITEVDDDVNSRAVFYHVGNYPSDHVATGFTQSFQELDRVSTVVPWNGCDAPGGIPDKYVYGYKNVNNGDMNPLEAVPFLHTISSPSPGNLPGGQQFMKTLTVNYNAETCTVSSVVDGNGNERDYSVGPGTNQTRVTLYGAYTHTVTFNNDMNMTDDTDGSGTVIYHADYDSADPTLKPSTVTDGLGQVWLYTWDQFGNMTTSTAPDGTETVYTWDTSQFPLGELTNIQEMPSSAPGYPRAPVSFTYYPESVSVGSPNGLLETMSWAKPGTPAGQPSSSYDPVAHPDIYNTASYTYNGYGQPLSVTMPGNDDNSDPVTTSWQYDTNLPTSVTVGSQTTSFGYDQMGNMTSIQDPAGNITAAKYDINCCPTTVWLPQTGQTGAGRAIMSMAYAYPGGPLCQVSETDESGHAAGTVTYEHGNEGELLASQAGSVPPVVYSYDGAYRVQTVTDHAGSATSYSYNGQGYLSQISYPDGSKDQFNNYDGNGNLKTYIDPKGIESDYTYDPVGRLTDINHFDTTHNPKTAITGLDVHAGINAFGQPLNMTDPNGAVGYQFDTNDTLMGITRSITASNGTTVVPEPIAYTYYPGGARETMTVPGGLFTYHYDAVGRPQSVVNSFGETTSWYLTALNQIDHQYMPNGLTTTYGYAYTLPTSCTTTIGDQTMAAFTVPATSGYDANGNRLTETASLPSNSNLSGEIDYKYDDRGQLIKESRAGQPVNSFYYDISGNPLYMRNTPNEFDAMNQLTGSTFDASGNPSHVGSANATFDPLDHLNSEGGVFSAGYGADGLRGWKETSTAAKNFYLYDGDLPVCELDRDGNPVAVNTFGAAGLISRRNFGTVSTSTFYSFDLSGNTALLTDSSGTVLSTHAFDAFGKDLNTTPTGDPFASFGGQFGNYRDSETGLTLMGQRYYDPNAGRFINRDPIGDAGGYNHYAYAMNNPVNYADPMGLDGNGDAWGWTDWLGNQTDSGSVTRQGVSMAVGFVPGLGSVMGAIGAITGCDYIAGTRLDTVGRVMSGVSAILPFMKGAGPLALFCEKGFLQCFAPGTPVQMADGTTKTIEQVKVGDEVMCENPETGKIEIKKVTRTFINKHKHTLLLTLSDGDKIEATPEHPFLVHGKGFVLADHLTAGMALTSQNGQEVKVVSVVPKQTDATTYNLEVADVHTYFVGKANGGVLVHNACGLFGILEGKVGQVSEKGIDVVENHLSQFGEYAPNTDMIDRLKSALLNGDSIDGADLSFYTHELSEATNMANGMGYDAAHSAALSKYGASQFSVYHPDVISANRSEFSSIWFQAWGL